MYLSVTQANTWRIEIRAIFTITFLNKQSHCGQQHRALEDMENEVVVHVNTGMKSARKARAVIETFAFEVLGARELCLLCNDGLEPLRAGVCTLLLRSQRGISAWSLAVAAGRSCDAAGRSWHGTIVTPDFGNHQTSKQRLSGYSTWFE